MSPLSFFAILIAPASACGEFDPSIPVHADEDALSIFESVDLPGGFTGFKMMKGMPGRSSLPQSPIDQMVNHVMNGGIYEEDEVPPEQIMQSVMLNGLQAGNLLRRSRLGFSRPPQDNMFEKLWFGSFDSDDLFSRPSVSSSSFSRTHTTSDGDGVVEVLQTQCQDGWCITRKSSQPSVNPFAKIKALRAPPPQAPAQDDQYAHDGVSKFLLKQYGVTESFEKRVPHQKEEIETPKQAITPLSPQPEEDVKIAGLETTKKQFVGNKELSEFANMLKEGFKAAAAQTSKVADTVKEGLKQGITAVADKFKEEHVMEV